ncbi:TRAP transporter large permease subunit [Gallibacter sp. Marseille-QA0791]|uniref:TRAP transporter large permease subunit n=1 Tax=Gallibacter sp. Marseille-QA0791 TaxID=3378781 RepID=UPI003D146F79
MRKAKGQRASEVTLRTFVTALRKSIPALLMPLIILGGIYPGLFTPTEAADVASA